MNGQAPTGECSFRHCRADIEPASLARMKSVMRILMGLVGLVVMVLGVKQFTKGVHELSGKPTVSAHKLGEVYTSKENGYSYRIPEKWENKPGPQPGMTMFVAPPDSKLNSNMVTTVETYEGSLADYVDANKKALSSSVPDAKVSNDAEFATDAKVAAHKTKLQNKMNNVELVQTMYFFEGAGGRKIIVTCTAPANLAGDLESVFDDSMKTFALVSP
jgi:hypothetical protein